MLVEGLCCLGRLLYVEDASNVCVDAYKAGMEEGNVCQQNFLVNTMS